MKATLLTGIAATLIAGYGLYDYLQPAPTAQAADAMSDELAKDPPQDGKLSTDLAKEPPSEGKLSTDLGTLPD